MTEVLCRRFTHPAAPAERSPWGSSVLSDSLLRKPSLKGRVHFLLAQFQPITQFHLPRLPETILFFFVLLFTPLKFMVSLIQSLKCTEFFFSACC